MNWYAFMDESLKVDKAKFDRLLKRMLKAEPAKRADLKREPKKRGKVIAPKVQGA
jgi:hypothetical protein